MDINKNKMIYCDHSATTYIKPEVLDAMMPYLKYNFGNASSSYLLGRKSREAVEMARCKVANAIGANSDEIYFTSGGSESDNMILSGVARKYKFKGKHIITTKFEHLAILNTCKSLEEEGFEVTYINVDKNGFVNIDELVNAIRDDTIIISVMYVNNEVGTIQNIQKIGSIARMRNIFFHTDAVQAIGHINIDVQSQNIDLLSMSSHKFYGPKGVGASYIRREIDFEPLVYGGHQECCKRAGTENVAGIVGMSKAIELATSNICYHNQKMLEYRDIFLSNILKTTTNLVINGSMENRVPNNLNISFLGIDSQTMLSVLDANGVCASGGSACNSSNTTVPSHVLTSMSVPNEIANCSIRFTFGESNDSEQIYYLSCIVCNILHDFNMKSCKI